MTDRKKIIEGIANVRNDIIDGYITEPELAVNILTDALELLEAQEPEIERQKRPDCEHANHDGAGCLGYCGCEQDDEPIDACKQCEKYTGNICAEY